MMEDTPRRYKLELDGYDVELHGEQLAHDGDCRLFKTDSGRVLVYVGFDADEARLFGFDPDETQRVITYATVDDFSEVEPAFLVAIKEALGQDPVVVVD